jgi:hypothetical protein
LESESFKLDFERNTPTKYSTWFQGDSGGAVICDGKVRGQIKNNKLRPNTIPDGPHFAGAMNDLARYRDWIDRSTRD